MTAGMFEEVGPDFAGVGGTSGKKKDKPKIDPNVPTILANGVTVVIQGLEYNPGDPGYEGLFKQAQGGSSAPGQDLTTFELGLLSGDQEALRIRQLMIQNGAVSANASIKTILSAYGDLLERKGKFAAIGKNVSIEQVIQQVGVFNASLPGTGSGTPSGPVASISEVDYGKPAVGDKSQGARQARKQIQEFFRETIGRTGTAEEIEEMRVALVKASAKAKPVTTVTREGNRTITKTTPGFDLKSWATGYISTKFADEDVEGALGQAQDKLKSLARAYGVDMGDSWYSAATKEVGKGKAVEDFLDEIKQVAIGRYPGLSDRFEKGASTIQIASPYIRSKAKILEMDEDMIDIDDMDIQQAIGFKDESGKFGTKPVWEFEKDLRRKPEWQYTKNAKDSYDTLMLKVLRDFGLMG